MCLTSVYTVLTSYVSIDISPMLLNRTPVRSFFGTPCTHSIPSSDTPDGSLSIIPYSLVLVILLRVGAEVAPGKKTVVGMGLLYLLLYLFFLCLLMWGQRHGA